MKTNPILWVGWMSRWGEPSPSHAYATGVYDCPDAAREAGDAESSYRVGKYEFQHSPCSVDLAEISSDEEVGDIPSRVVVASVSREVKNREKSRCHFLGVFSDEETAAEVAKEMYPNWSLSAEWFEVTRSEEDVQDS